MVVAISHRKQLVLCREVNCTLPNKKLNVYMHALVDLLHQFHCTQSSRYIHNILYCVHTLRTYKGAAVQIKKVNDGNDSHK